MLSYMNNPSTMVQHLQVQQDVYTRMSNSGYMDEFRDEINLYFTFIYDRTFIYGSKKDADAGCYVKIHDKCC